ncbi:TspO/MBR family protein [Hansschlegelia plantiphila]|uniref:TspO/MBR-related protein n=1 Tax=Hansschlegelia plantiphila TaxID=374655 RepID=A0A9W6IZJ2_9HYPH|nr:TspO/MBR family protein [Hansschlegelia plantiphila]GLK66500.1 TspO/MBR-related protein [Hansschlegelia plantiphila]
MALRPPRLYISAMTTLAGRQPWLSLRSLLVLLCALAVCFGAAQLGAAATYPNLAPWYEGLAKPPFNPPNAAFPIAWSILFALMAVSLWRVVILGEGTARRRALIAFAVQLAFNIGWSFAFFAARSPLLGLIEIGPFLAAIAWTIGRFRPIDGIAAALLYPYLAWVTFAALLNASILVLNG